MDFKHLEVDLTTGVRPLVRRLRDLLMFTWRYTMFIFFSLIGHINDQLSSSVIIFLIWPHQSFKIDNHLCLCTYRTLVTLYSRDIFIDSYQIEYYPLVLLCVLYAEVKPEPANDGFLWGLWLMKSTWYSSEKKSVPKFSFYLRNYILCWKLLTQTDLGVSRCVLTEPKSAYWWSSPPPPQAPSNLPQAPPHNPVAADPALLSSTLLKYTDWFERTVKLCQHKLNIPKI